MTQTNGYMRNRGLKKGFETFAAWFPVGKTVRNIAPTDLDAMLHNGETNQCILLEFKPRDSEITRGQFRLLEDLTHASHNSCGFQMIFPFIIWDEFSDISDLQKLPDDYTVVLSEIKPGMKFDNVVKVRTSLGTWRKFMVQFCATGIPRKN